MITDCHGQAALHGATNTLKERALPRAWTASLRLGVACCQGRFVLDELGECLDRSSEGVDAARGSAHDQAALEYGHDQVGQVGSALRCDGPDFELADQRPAPPLEDLLELAAEFLALGG
jgi:hypothetical protein